MNKEIDDNYACYLEMKGGISPEIKYDQNFVRAPKSQFPGKPPAHAGKEIPHTEAMKISLGK